MSLDKKVIEEFQVIWNQEFKEEIDEVKAQEMVRRLLNLFRVIYKPKTNENSKLSNN